jgi:hypothetical protein
MIHSFTLSVTRGNLACQFALPHAKVLTSGKLAFFENDFSSQKGHFFIYVFAESSLNG